jgi:hypothetical protein
MAPAVPSDLVGLFEKFCSFGAGGKGADEMDNSKFAKFCRDTDLFDKAFAAADADVIFTRVKAPGERRINYAVFRTKALSLIAERKGCVVSELVAKIKSSEGPLSTGTKAESVKLYDDKTNFTGLAGRKHAHEEAPATHERRSSAPASSHLKKKKKKKAPSSATVTPRSELGSDEDAEEDEEEDLDSLTSHSGSRADFPTTAIDPRHPGFAHGFSAPLHSPSRDASRPASQPPDVIISPASRRTPSRSTPSPTSEDHKVPFSKSPRSFPVPTVHLPDKLNVRTPTSVGRESPCPLEVGVGLTSELIAAKWSKGPRKLGVSPQKRQQSPPTNLEDQQVKHTGSLSPRNARPSALLPRSPVVVATIEEAVQLDLQGPGDGTCNGAPIEIKGRGLYVDIMKPLHHPSKVIITKVESFNTNPLGSPMTSVATSESALLTDLQPLSPQSEDTFTSPTTSSMSPTYSPITSPNTSVIAVATQTRALPECTFQTSHFRAAYATAKVPTSVDEFLDVLQALIQTHAALRNINPAIAGLFFNDLKEAATKENRPEMQYAAARVWSSPKTLEKREMAFILNDAIREDTPELMPYVAAITRAINLLLVGMSRLSMAPASNVVYRGGGLPDQFRSFFTPGKKYRAPMFVATSVNRTLCLKTFCRRAQNATGHPPALWVIAIDEREGCKHVNYIHTTECLEELEYLFSPYSVFTIERVDWKATPEWKDPHVIHLRAAIDNRLEPEDLPLCPWS